MSHIMCNQRCDTLVKAAGDEIKRRADTDLLQKSEVADGLLFGLQVADDLPQRQYDPDKLVELLKRLKYVEGVVGVVMSLYPEVMKCVGCNTCTRACPMEIDVMGYINSAMRGDVARAAKTSFDCIQCGLCSARCPAQIAHYHVAQLCRRLYGRYVLPQADHTAHRVEEILAGKYDAFLEDLAQQSEDDLRKLYVAREPEPQDSEGWEPQDKTYL